MVCAPGQRASAQLAACRHFEEKRPWLENVGRPKHSERLRSEISRRRGALGARRRDARPSGDPQDGPPHGARLRGVERRARYRGRTEQGCGPRSGAAVVGDVRRVKSSRTDVFAFGVRACRSESETCRHDRTRSITPDARTCGAHGRTCRGIRASGASRGRVRWARTRTRARWPTKTR